MRLALWALITGIIIAIIVNAQECGTWGLNCFSYAFAITTATMAVSSTLFLRLLEQADLKKSQRLIAGVMGGICMTLTIAGLVAIMAVIL